MCIPLEEYILALKLLAGRQKDRGDILALCQQLHIQAGEQASQIVDEKCQVERYEKLSKGKPQAAIGGEEKSSGVVIF